MNLTNIFLCLFMISLRVSVKAQAEIDEPQLTINARLQIAEDNIRVLTQRLDDELQTKEAQNTLISALQYLVSEHESRISELEGARVVENGRLQLLEVKSLVLEGQAVENRDAIATQQTLITGLQTQITDLSDQNFALQNLLLEKEQRVLDLENKTRDQGDVIRRLEAVTSQQKDALVFIEDEINRIENTTDFVNTGVNELLNEQENNINILRNKTQNQQEFINEQNDRTVLRATDINSINTDLNTINARLGELTMVAHQNKIEIIAHQGTLSQQVLMTSQNSNLIFRQGLELQVQQETIHKLEENNRNQTEQLERLEEDFVQQRNESMTMVTSALTELETNNVNTQAFEQLQNRVTQLGEASATLESDVLRLEGLVSSGNSGSSTSTSGFESRLTQQERQLLDQSRLIAEQGRRIDENARRIIELSRG